MGRWGNMIRFKRRLSKARATLFLIASVMLLLFQNCSNGFEVLTPAGEVSLSSSKDSSALSPTPSGVAVPPVCTFDGKSVVEGGTVSAFTTSSVPFGQSCVPETRTCVKGALSGAAQFSSCNVGTPAACLFDGKTIAHSQSVPTYQSSTVAFGEKCVSETRLCEDGKLAGSFKFPSCAVAAPAMCLFNGSSLPSGQSVKAFKSATVPFGQICEEQVRACNDGKLSGGYTFVSCTVSPKPPPEIQAIAAGNEHTCVIHKGALKCWGSNKFGQLGDGTKTDRSAPVTIFQSGVTEVAIQRDPLANFATCAVVNSSLFCWGDAGYSTNFQSAPVANKPVQIIDSGVTKVAMSENRLCAIVNAQVLCRPLYNGTTFKTIVNSGATDLVSGQYHFCATVNSGVQCWGGVIGVWGNGDGPTTDTPVTYVEGPIKNLSGAIYFACATSQNDDLYCFGNLQGVKSMPTGNSPPIKIAENVSVSTGSVSVESLSYVSNKQLYLISAFGLNRSGTRIPMPEYKTVKEVPLFNNVDLVSVGDAHLCASMDNNLYCFGDNSLKQSGNSVSGFLMPTAITPLETFRVPL